MSSARDWRNVGVLATCQMLFGAGRTLVATTGPLIFLEIGANKALSTLPVTLLVAGTAIASIPASYLMRYIGRGPGFFAGSLIGVVGALISLLGIYWRDEWIFCAGALMFGFFAGFAQLYRFAVADVAAREFRGKAISLVLAGGVIAAFLGPELAKHGQYAFSPLQFFGAYIFLACLALLTAIIVLAVDIPKLTEKEAADPGRPIGTIMRDPIFVVACVTATIAQAVMNLLMTSTPLAMHHAQHMFSSTALVVEWHVFFMFAPGFFSGSLISRFGPVRMIVAGMFIQMLSVAVALAGESVPHFWFSLALLGLGWNFAFTAGTTLLTEVHTPSERAKVQAANNFILYFVVGIVSIASGALMHYFGWKWVNLGALPLLIVATAAAAWLAVHRKKERAAAALAE